jgi:hypothetical protein
MSDPNLFRPRRRPLLRLVLALGTSALLLFAASIVIWLRVNVVPPDCLDSRTLALVRQSLTGRFNIPAAVTIEDIETHSGGYLAFRFACQASLRNIDPNALSAGTAVPGKVFYVSRLTPDRQRHQVSVSIEPLLKLEKVQ